MAKKTRTSTPATGRAATPPGAAVAPDTTAPDVGATPLTHGPSGPVWDALTATPDTSVAAIATTAGVSTAAARKTLIALEAAGHATRTPGGHNGGKRAPDIWQATCPATDDTPATAPPDDDQDQRTQYAPAPEANGASTDTKPQDSAAGSGAGGNGAMDEAAAALAHDALTVIRDAVVTALEALAVGDGDAAVTAAEAVYAESGGARRLVRAAAHGRPRSASGHPRSHPGELRAKVAVHLQTYPGKDFTPHEIGKAIGHSAGAIVNALDRLTGLGEAAITCDRPRRFTIASTGGAATTATTS